MGGGAFAPGRGGMGAAKGALRRAAKGALPRKLFRSVLICGGPPAQRRIPRVGMLRLFP